MPSDIIDPSGIEYSVESNNRSSGTDDVSSLRERIRHSASHIMADAVQSIFPEVKFAIGPPTEDGFYYDFQLPRALTEDDLGLLERKMTAIVAADLPFERTDVDRSKASDMFQNQPFKLEIIDAITDDSLGIYSHGGFSDLCNGPHVRSTGEVISFKLLSVAGAYWRGDEHRPMLQRIYGTAFESQAALDQYVQRLEEASKRDHRKLGRELGLFTTHEELGGGLICWHPKGARVRSLVEDFWRDEHLNSGYSLVYSPHIGKSKLWETSGHLEFYSENMYSPLEIDEQDYYLKPMNCPFHILIYRSSLRSYRDLPMCLAELGTVYRYERTGVLHGLLRVRGFTQDDAHIFCRPDQLNEEVRGVLELTLNIIGSFGFKDYQIYLSDRPEKYVGELSEWDMATNALRETLEDMGLDYALDSGGGAFYGPKIDLKIEDAIGRYWQCTTVQFDFNLPSRFDISYIGEDGKEHRPFMVHRAILGSLERFIGVLIEHYGGAFPVWLAPVQALVIPITDRHIEYSREVMKAFQAAGIRIEVDERGERMNQKIRQAQLDKIPYMLVIGDKEVDSDTVSVRVRGGENKGAMDKSSVIELIQDEIITKA